MTEGCAVCGGLLRLVKCPECLRWYCLPCYRAHEDPPDEPIVEEDDDDAE